MSQDHNNIYSIVERLRVLEEGLDKNQRSVNQLGATFKPKTVAVLTAKQDPKNPLRGKLVGGNESADPRREAVQEDLANEDILEKVKRSFTDFIKHVEDEIKDSDIKDKKHEDTDLKKKEKKDRALISKTVDESPATNDQDDWYDENGNPSDSGSYDAGGRYHPDREPDMDAGYDAYKERDYTESVAVKTVTMEDGAMVEIHGNERDGFEIRREGRGMRSRFENLDHAVMALEMFAHRRRQADESQDYMEER